MSRTIAARYDNGVFVPLEKVTLPEHAIIRLEIPDEYSRRPHRQIKGMLAEMGIEVTEKDIHDIRSEMWKNFPRDIS